MRRSTADGRAPVPLVLLALLGSGLAGCGQDSHRPFAHLPATFEVEHIGAIFNVDDAGVGDIDGDGLLDLWTTNHSAQQWIALAEPGGKFSGNAVPALGLHQDGRLPGIEPTLARPDCGRAHHIYLQGATLAIESGALTETVSGEVELPWPAQLDATGGAVWQPLDCMRVAGCTRARFTTAGTGRLQLRTIPPRSDGFPIRIELDERVDRDGVRVGSACLRPTGAVIEFELKDRHGLLLADLRGDPRPDLFVSRGGARGRLAEVHPGARDEFWVNGPTGYQSVAAAAGLVKAGCPGRQVGGFDIDGDGDLDIYQVCGRASGAGATSRNRLYVQVARGRFEERAAAWGVALEGAGSFAWTAPTATQPPRLLWVAADGVQVLERRGQRFVEVWRQQRQGGESDGLLLAAPTPDGVTVAIVGERSALLTLNDAGYALHPFASVGLPPHVSTGNWVDVDGDGRLELFLVPHGLFASDGEGFWSATGEFALSDGEPTPAHSSWFDADADGDLDLWLVQRDAKLAPRPLRWPVKRLNDALARRYITAMEAVIGRASWEPHVWEAWLVRNHSSKPTHLAVTVRNHQGNREAVGAQVELDDGRERRRAVVAAAGHARLSQTLYEVYLGTEGMGHAAQLAVSIDGVVRRQLTIDLGDREAVADRVVLNRRLLVELPLRRVAERQP